MCGEVGRGRRNPQSSWLARLSSCNAGFGDCDGTAGNGCETNVSSNVSNCGACAQPCSNNGGTPSCSAGNCSIVCSAGYADCDGNARSNGCEINTNSNNSNCGNCGNVCGGGTTCINGTCQTTSCSSGTENCDGQPGCECSGTGCCATSCQTKHNNGLGQFYYDYDPLNTYTSVTGNEACAAFTGNPAMCSGYVCTGPGKPQLVCSDGYSKVRHRIALPRARRHQLS